MSLKVVALVILLYGAIDSFEGNVYEVHKIYVDATWKAFERTPIYHSYYKERNKS